MDYLLKLTINPLDIQKFVLMNTKTGKEHNFANKTSLRNYLRTEFQIKDAKLSDLLSDILTNKIIYRNSNLECIRIYTNNNNTHNEPKNQTLDNNQNNNLTKSQNNDIIDHLTEYTSWVSKEDFEFNNKKQSNDLTEITTTLHGILTTLKVLKEESIQNKKDKKILNDKVDSSNSKIDNLTDKYTNSINISDLVSAKSEFNNYLKHNEKNNKNLSTIQESIISAPSVKSVYKPINLTSLLESNISIDNDSDINTLVESSHKSLKDVYKKTVFEYGNNDILASIDLNEEYNNDRAKKKKRRGNLTRKLRKIYRRKR